MGTLDPEAPASAERVSLSPLQQRILSAIASLPESGDFALAGGAALLVSGIGDRTTRDLDFFATRADAVDALRPELERLLHAEGLSVEIVRSSPGFVRYEISDGQGMTEMDLAWDYRMRQPRPGPVGFVLDRDELAADKMLALYGRAEARDFVDVFGLRSFYSRERLCALAHEKDRGFVTDMFVAALAGIDRRDRVEFDIDDRTLEVLHREFEEWRDDLVRAIRQADDDLGTGLRDPGADP